jgi:serine/threonine-protein kinase
MADAILLDTAVSTDLGSYRLGAILGEGGMGSVYRAEHRALGRKVAVKILHPALARDPELVRRFFGEARVVNAINHQHIVEIHDFVLEPGGRSYFVMELLDGQDLVEAREQGSFDLTRTLDIAIQTCSALQAAHEKGVIHRDIKPENVMLIERDGRPDFVKLLDFGVAKMPHSGIGPARTVAGMIVGTPEYMSPEQAGGRPVDARSDIYSMGALLFWMLTGHVPFEASGFDKLIVMRLTSAPPRLPAVGPGGERRPASLARLVARCLERNPADRFQSMAEVSAALEAVAAELAAPVKSHRLARVLGASAVVVALAGAGVWIGLRGRTQLRPGRNVVSATPTRPAQNPFVPSSPQSGRTDGPPSSAPTAAPTPTALATPPAVPTATPPPTAVAAPTPPPAPHKREPHRRGQARAKRAQDATAIVNPYEE